ncbi:MAG: DNA alkylation repair enzyme [Lentisphaerae bacterium ADurb.Bin242]|nr:MAG: DNA alkylation repair enzyme [Lentisphaerae bacterium ADurb.Bin242]
MTDKMRDKTNLDYSEVETAVRTAGSPEKAIVLQGFFKTGKGQYGEGDLFLGVTVPASRKIARKYRELPLPEVLKLLKNPYHEVRFCALMILVEQYERGDEKLRDRIYLLYLGNTRYINNWDLVDLSAPDIVGTHLLNGDRSVLDRLAGSGSLWEQRIAMVSTITFIRKGEFADTFRLAERFRTHRHDLMHKAAGWMLREVGKRDRSALTEFLRKHRLSMPRTMLRYAIEHYPEEQRREFLKR